MRELLTIEYCERNRTKKAARGYKTVCPSCVGRDLWVTKETSSCYCFECGTSYTLVISLDAPYKPKQRALPEKQFDTKAIRSAYAHAADYYHSCISKEHEQALLARGISQEAISFFKIGFCPSGISPMYLTETAKEAGLADGKGRPWLSDRIVFPYIAEGEITDLRGRSFLGEDPKYKSLYHRAGQRGAIYPFNYDAAMQKARETKTLIVTEGEIKAMVADQLNFAIVAFPGMLSYRPALIQQPGIKTIVIFDNSVDLEDRIRVDKAIARLATHIPEFSVVTLPLLGEIKMDIDTYLLHKRGGADRFHYAVDNAIGYTYYQRLRNF